MSETQGEKIEKLQKEIMDLRKEVARLREDICLMLDLKYYERK